MTPRAERATVLDVRGLGVERPGGVRPLRSVELRVRAGECVVVVGSSGSGKTTLLRALLGLLPRSARVTGSALVGGTEVVGAQERTLRRLRGGTVGYVGQDPFASFDPLRSVGHHVAEAWRARGGAPPDGAAVARLAALGIADAAVRARHRPHAWSGGMLQRASIAAAGAHGPLLTLADEPTSALDAELADDVLAALRRDSGALLMVSHDLRLARTVADRIAVLHEGRIVEDGPAADVLGRPAHPATVALVEALPRPRAAARRTPPGGPPVLSARGLTRRYPGAGTVLAGLDLDVRAGEFVALTGPSGVGKSTALRLLAGVERPDAGELRHAGGPVWRDGRRWSPRGGWVMPVHQDPRAGLDPRWPVWRTLAEPGGPRRRADALAAARAALDAAGLTGVDPRARPGELSTGQCQRVAILRALAARPALIVADEPTSALDTVTAAAVLRLLRAAADAGAALLVVSHDTALMSRAADRVVRLPVRTPD
ncbi:ABC transporter ATP-binding protein [Streptomyces avicenniae]|uniref:ABC transporter ATP-binding protein n=1 Tax=Streptomyces avicenniae TaxID=500153 RepID=UPI00069C17F7|nr:ATP-binding cassette domain-containing protein [Streptomyces avicenniae]